jgi:hypothetical protein
MAPELGIIRQKLVVMGEIELSIQDQEVDSTTSTITGIKFMFQSSRYFLVAFMALIGFPTAAYSQGYFSDQYIAMARDFKNQSEGRLTRLKAQVSENREGIKYIGEKYLDFYIKQMVACESSSKSKKNISSENLYLLNAMNRTYLDAESLANLGLRNIDNNVSLAKTSLDSVCPPADGDFNGYIECTTRIEKYNSQLLLKLEANTTKSYFYNLLSDPISRLNQCINDKGSYEGMNLNGANNLMTAIRDEISKQYQKISRVSTGLM